MHTLGRTAKVGLNGGDWVGINSIYLLSGFSFDRKDTYCKSSS